MQNFEGELIGLFLVIGGEEDAVRRVLIHKEIDYRYIRDVNRFFFELNVF
jgi:hypothetical protein